MHSQRERSINPSRRVSDYNYGNYGKDSEDLDDSLVSRMARQVKLTTKVFKRLVSCPMSRADYEERIKHHL